MSSETFYGPASRGHEVYGDHTAFKVNYLVCHNFVHKNLETFRF